MATSSCGNNDVAAPRQITQKNALHCMLQTSTLNCLHLFSRKNTAELHGFLDSVSRDCERNCCKNKAENRQFLAHFRAFPWTVSPGYTYTVHILCSLKNIIMYTHVCTCTYMYMVYVNRSSRKIEVHAQMVHYDSQMLCSSAISLKTFSSR